MATKRQRVIKEGPLSHPLVEQILDWADGYKAAGYWGERVKTKRNNIQRATEDLVARLTSAEEKAVKLAKELDDCVAEAARAKDASVLMTREMAREVEEIKKLLARLSPPVILSPVIVSDEGAAPGEKPEQMSEIDEDMSVLVIADPEFGVEPVMGATDLPSWASPFPEDVQAKTASNSATMNVTSIFTRFREKVFG